MINDLMRAAEQRSASVTGLAQRLVQVPSQGGVDSYEPVLAVVEDWLDGQDLGCRRLRSPAGELVGLLVEVAGAGPGPWWALDACLDTAGFGDQSAWSFPPTSGEVRGHMLLGRGAADSKLAASMFCHLAMDLKAVAARFAGGVAVLLDVDEHTGGFGGARAYLADPAVVRPSGVMIGYPGLDEVVVGGRGLWRAVLRVHGTSGHSGSSRSAVSAISRAARMVIALEGAELPPAPVGAAFGLSPKLSVTAVHGGEGFSVTADLCTLNVDIRLTPAFDAHDAETLVRKAIAEVDGALPGPAATDVVTGAVWPPFQLTTGQQPGAALVSAARAAALAVTEKTAGPSNIGNFLAGEGIAATAGFGVPYTGLHGTDEQADLRELPRVYAVYHRAVLDLLGVN
ncbi:M20 family metallopeptidase [Streptacidiphilus sp. EB103A]|uniref:M20 family metallopeptidase n=1 Tax=Streptacidiphilus sp. EB103A TaxID=3156275 RepID=UPI003514F21B